MTVRKRFASVVLAVVMAMGLSTAAMGQTQDGLVNVSIGDVTVLEDVRVAVAANVIANVCALVQADVLVLATQIDGGSLTDFECNQRGNGRAWAITNN